MINPGKRGRKARRQRRTRMVLVSPWFHLATYWTSTSSSRMTSSRLVSDAGIWLNWMFTLGCLNSEVASLFADMLANTYLFCRYAWFLQVERTYLSWQCWTLSTEGWTHLRTEVQKSLHQWGQLPVWMACWIFTKQSSAWCKPMHHCELAALGFGQIILSPLCPPWGGCIQKETTTQQNYKQDRTPRI